MTDKERKEFLEILDDKIRELSNSKEASQKFLVDLGIFTKKGNLTKKHKHICIPQDQD